MNKNNKQRRPFKLYDDQGTCLAKGICYEQWNCQILWRIDIGWTAEQYHHIGQTLFLLPNIKYFYWED